VIRIDGKTQATYSHQARMPAIYHVTHRRALEVEAICVMRGLLAGFERSVPPFSVGKGSIVLRFR
jgi:hypothetical protein